MSQLKTADSNAHDPRPPRWRCDGGDPAGILQLEKIPQANRPGVNMPDILPE